MSNVVDTSVVDDETMVIIRNLTDMPVAYHVPSLGDLRRELPPRASIRVRAGELRQLNYERGGSLLLHDYINVGNVELAREFGVSDDTVEYNWTIEDVDKALTTDDLDVLRDAMDFAPEGIKQTIADRAVELKIPDSNRRNIISSATGLDIDSMIKNKEIIDADKVEKKTTAKRRVSSTTTKQRRVKSESQEKE